MLRRKEIISIVVPCYNEEKTLFDFYNELKDSLKNMKGVNFEFIFIDDGSTDSTLKILREFSKKDKNCHYLSFSRNFFKEAAIVAGLEFAKGDYTVIIDADLQDPPSLIPKMYKLIKEENYDCVAARRINRKGESRFISFLSVIFYKFVNLIGNIKIEEGARDFRMMNRSVKNSILELKEYNRFSKGIFSFVGFNVKWLEYSNIKRKEGKTKIKFFKRFSYAIEGLISFSTKPLIFSSIIGVLFCLISFISIFIIILKTLIFGDPVAGWPSLVCIIFFVSGIQLFCMGIIGLYLSKIYLETKNRPLYIVKEIDKKVIK